MRAKSHENGVLGASFFRREALVFGVALGDDCRRGLIPAL